MKAILRNHRQSPRKMRLVADMVKGKKVEQALSLLKFVNKKASLPIMKLMESALSNAKNLGADSKNLFVKEIRVDGGQVLMRRMPRARGSAFPIKKRTSHISLSLEEIPAETKEVKQEKSEKPKSEKKPKAAKVSKAKTALVEAK